MENVLPNENIARRPVEPQPEVKSEPTPFKRSEKQEVIYEDGELLPSEYEIVKKYPLVVDLMGYKEQLSHFDMKPISKEIDIFLREEIKRLGLKDTKEAYQEVLDDYLKKAQIPKESDIYSKIEKLVQFVRIQAKLLKDLKEREDLLKADPATLSSAKLKQLIELHAKSTN